MGNSQLKVSMMVRLKQLLTMALLLNTTVLQAGQVGTTTGSFQVTASGDSAYSMAIEVPPGIMGVVPQVSINYSSGGGNGLVGVGASLSGLSSITRCQSTIVQDNVSMPLQYNNDDYFCLNGQRLILMSGSYGIAGSVYQTQVESFQRVTAYGNVAGGPAYFEVLGKGGSKLVFGQNEIERNIDPISGVVSSWSISYVEDKHSNRVDYEYQLTNENNATQTLPSRITYGHNANLNITGDLSVKFVYEQRPDKSNGYVRGQQFVNNVRISNVQTFVGTEMVKDYRITYDLSPVSLQSRITTITECSGEANCLLPVSFTWQNYNFDWEQGTSLPVAALTSQGNMRGAAVDVNNDGHTDWVTAIRTETGQEILETYLNNGGTWETSNDFVPPVPLFDYERHPDGLNVSEMVDINSDGKVDWVQAYRDASGIINKVYLNTGNGWALSTATLPALLADLTDADTPKSLSQFIDIDGDSRADLLNLVRHADGSHDKTLWLNKVEGWIQNTSYVFHRSRASNNYEEYSKGAVNAFFMDINADGLVDYVSAFKNTQGNIIHWVGLNTGSEWQHSLDYALPVVLADYSTPTPTSYASTVDLNGDGLIDIIQAHQKPDGTILRRTWLNTGNGWVENAELTPPNVAWLSVGDTVQTIGVFADITNDGLPDFIQSYKNSASVTNRVWRNTGTGWQETNELSFPNSLTELSTTQDSKARGFLIDANSDGRGDLIFSSGGTSSTVYLGGTNSNSYALPEVITTFSDGLGNEHTVEYMPATYGDVYTPYQDGSYPNLDVV